MLTTSAHLVYLNNLNHRKCAVSSCVTDTPLKMLVTALDGRCDVSCCFLLMLARVCLVVIDACLLIAFQCFLPVCLPRLLSKTSLSGPGVSVCNSSHDTITWRAENRTHLSKQTRPSTEHSRKASNVRGIPSRLDDQLRWVLIARSQV